MTKEVAIKAYTRKSKKGKTVSVRSYSRSSKGTGVIAPPKGSKDSGEEYEEVQNLKQEPVELGPYAASNAKLMQQRWEALRHGKSAVNSIKRYHEYLQNSKRDAFRKSLMQQAETPSEAPRKSPYVSKVEGKIARFLEKYSGRKYKKYF